MKDKDLSINLGDPKNYAFTIKKEKNIRKVLRTDQSSRSILKNRSGVAASSKTLYKHIK